MDCRGITRYLCRCTLPRLEQLELASISTQHPNGERLLQQLVAGAAGSLRRLDLHVSAFGCGLGMLSAASQLTWLNLAGARGWSLGAASPTGCFVPRGSGCSGCSDVCVCVCVCV